MTRFTKPSLTVQELESNIKLHSSTIQTQVAYGYRWPSLFSHMTVF